MGSEGDTTSSNGGSATWQALPDAAQLRNRAAARRDRKAGERDAAARERDRLAAALDDEDDRLAAATHDHGGGYVATGILRRAAAQREAAAGDRELAAEDRRQAARDRRALSEELALEGVDNLTGALRRRAGLDAIQRELDRTRRTGEPLVIAFIDVDGLKLVNDTEGHAAGDELLRQVAASLEQHLRAYDVIARTGGDEFACAVSGHDVAGVEERFRLISARLAAVADGATFAVGLAERRQHDTLDDLLRRADTAMSETRRGARR